jgi:heme/copper-type cytochrome/quinol oxidase subunit 4
VSAPAAAAAARAPRTTTVALGMAAGAAILGGLAGALVVAGKAADVVALALVVLPVAVWRKPHLAPAGLLAGALTVEQFSRLPISSTAAVTTVDPPLAPEPLTAHIPLFVGMGGLHIAPADLLLLLVCFVYLARSAERSRPRTVVWYGIVGLAVAVMWGVLLGVAHHGDVRVAFMETRPYVYLIATYLLTAGLVTDRRGLRLLLWTLVGCVALKAVLGLVIFMRVRHMNPRPEAVLGHEESFFFALLIFLVLALWLWNVEGRLRTVATALLPFVALADIANDRRAAWLVLGGGLIAMIAVAVRALPERRHVLRRGIVAALVVSVVYFPAYWNKGGGLAQPARAVHSMIAPDPRDASSDLYRLQENANLKENIRAGHGIGNGFGVPIRYSLPITDISAIDPMIAYIPHNGVLYVLMRMGLLGGLALWGLVAAGIVTAARVARSADREQAVVGAVVVAALVGWVLMGAVDQAFFFYRIAFVAGTLLGLLDGAASRMSWGPR